MDDYRNDIERYLRGELTPAEMHRLEKLALSDPFLADALDGGAETGAVEFSRDVRALEQLIGGKKNESRWFSPLRMAASVAVLGMAGYVVYLSVKPIDPLPPIAQQESKKPAASPLTTASDTGAAKPAAELLSSNQRAPVVQKLEYAVTKKRNSSAGPAETEAPVHSAPAATITAESSSVAAVTPPVTRQEPVEEEIIDVKTEKKAVAAGTSKMKMTLDKAEKIPAPPDDDVRDKAAPQTIRGKVTMFDDRRAAGGVTVMSKGTGNVTITDAQGNYTISSATPVHTLVFSLDGIETSEVDADGDAKVDIQLAVPGKSGEVVVAGDKPSAAYNPMDPDITFAVPSVGMKAFNKYLTGNVRYPSAAIENKIQGNVSVHFTVRKDSTLSDFKILHGIGGGCDEELVRLIQEGPAWVPLLQHEVYFDSKVRVRLKFTLPK